MRIIRFCLMAVLSGTLMACTTPTLYHQAFGTDSMNVPASNGGSILLFFNAAKEAKKKDLHPRFSTGCYSACGLFADRVRPNACVTKDAFFAFHQAYIEMLIAPNVYHETRDVPPSSQDIASWVLSHGGYPADGFLFMKYPDTTLFWPLCK